MVKYGVDKADIFQTNDLFERKDLGAVTNTIFALDRAVKPLTFRACCLQSNKNKIEIYIKVGRHPEWTGARLQGQAGGPQSVYFNQ